MTNILLGLLIVTNILSFGRFEFAPILYNLKFLLSLLLLFWILANVMIKKDLLKFPSELFFLFYIWFFIISISLLFSFNFNESFPIFISYLILFILTLILLPYYMNLKEGNFHNVLKVFYWSFLIALLIIFIFGLKDGGSNYVIGDRERYQSYFTNPNFLGLFSFGGILTSLAVYVLTKSKRYLLVIFFYTALIYISDSRTALFLFFLIIFLMIFSKNIILVKNNLNIVYSIILKNIMNLTLLTLAMILIIRIIVNINEFYSIANKLTSNRVFYWTIHLKQLNIGDWFFGKGQGYMIPGITFDNFYIKTIVETGIFSFLILILILFKMLFVFYKRIFVKGYYEISEFYTLFLIMSIFIYSIFENILFSLGNSVTIFFWTYIGYQLLQEQNYEEN
ncbi:hypothetical protein [Rummeliibacillus pycnus]|uniref:hypothetical protein n=1 Tax=Rummeliibacillus pycnus TaxID=101070 RepID=UPI0037C68A0F